MLSHSLRISFCLSGWEIAAGVWACLLGTQLASADEAATQPAAAESSTVSAPKVAGLVVLYDFQLTEGDVVVDRSGAGESLDLRIANPSAVRRTPGALQIHGKTRIQSAQPAEKIVNAVRRSGELTIEAWLRPANVEQAGPARIVTLSRGSSERNFTLGQDGGRYDIRLRSSATTANGIPSVSTRKGDLTTELTHLVYSRDRSGRTHVYVNGELQEATTVSGSTRDWSDSHKLALANEFGSDRPWEGIYYLVAIYSRNLSPAEVQRHFEAGPVAPTAHAVVAQDAKSQKTPAAQLFENEIAPLIAKHCLECHDTPTNKGGLDLSRRDAALAGGDSGSVVMPGNADGSLLWEYITADDMPANRPPLSADEKALLRRWIDGGATWSLELIEAIAYEHDRRAGENWIRRLTVPEYIETVQAAVGVDIAQDARRLLPADLRADGFSNTAYNLTVDLKHVNAYAQLAEIIVDQMDVLKFARRFSKKRRMTDNDMRSLITKIGKWLLRGPLDEHEIVDYRGITTTVMSAGGDFEEAVGLVIQAMLQSPRFVYRLENQRGDGLVWPVSEYELASRLSYIVWGGPPDKQLMDAAEAGELYASENVAAQVRRMLQDPRAIERSQQFVYEWLNLSRLENVRPNRDKFPNWEEQLASDMRDETLEFFKVLAWDEQRPLSELLNAQFTVATGHLARHYGLQPKSEKSSRYDLSSVPSRGGLLTHGSVLNVGGDEASMVARGLFVLQELLRGSVKDPPPCVDTRPPPTKSGLTQRGIAQIRIADATCGGCHAKFEPLAFGLERFDGIGAFHEVDEHGNELREDGDILFPGTAEPITYETSAELMELLASSARVSESITWKLAQFAVGRPLNATDAPVVDTIHAAAQENGGTYASLISAIAMSDLVQLMPTEE